MKNKISAKIFLSVFLFGAFLFVYSCTANAETVSDLAGEINNGVYTNQKFGIKASFDLSWQVIPLEETGKITGMPGKITYEQIASGQRPFFIAIKNSGIANVNIVLTPLDGKERSEEEFEVYINSILDDTAKFLGGEFLAMQGLENYRYEKTSVNFLGKKYKCMKSSANRINMKAMKMYQTLVIYFVDDYMLNITATSWGFDMAEEIFNCFGKL